jgi:hypothetical protein
MAKSTKVTGIIRRTRRSASEWQAEVASWRASGLTATEYASSRSIHGGTLMGWTSRLAKAEARPLAVPESQVGRRFFVPVTAAQHGVGPGRAQLSAEIILTSGRRVRVSGDFGIEQLGRLLEVVEAGGRC